MQDEMREPLNVFAVDEKMNRATGSIPYRSLIWRRKYTEPGDFEMVIPANIYDPSWYMIVCDERPEAGLVQKVEYTDDAQTYDGIDSITISGFFLESILNRIVLLEESPEEQKVYIPAPRRTVYWKNQNPTIYKNSSGDYVYENASGNYTNASTGEVMDSTDGLTQVDYAAAAGKSYGTNRVESSFSYYTNADKTQITRVNNGGVETTYDILFSDDKGNVFYETSYGSGIAQAVGVVENSGSTYHARIKSWHASPQDVYGHYYTKLVKGPWQRTEMMEPVTVGDSIDIVFKWARRMMGDWILYVEPEIEGEQKSVDPSFQYLGDLMYKTLYEVGASLRIEYSFELNAYYLSVYRGDDRTQGNGIETASSETTRMMAAPVPASSSAAISRLPDGYTEVEYIESSGTQYIDTGITPDSDTITTIDAQVMQENSADMVLFGVRSSANQQYAVILPRNNGSLDVRCGSSTVAVAQSQLQRAVYSLSAQSFSFNGQATQIGAAAFSTTYTMPIFAWNSYGSVSAFASCRVFAAKVYQSGVLVRDFVPVTRNGEAGLYDLIHDEFYGNSGSGSFDAGNPAAQITYMPNSTAATGSTEPTKGFVGNTVEIAQCGFSVENGTFTGWNTQADGKGTTYLPGAEFVLPSGGITLYATWDIEEPPEPEPPSGNAPWAVFSDTWGTLTGYSASRDTSNYKNTCHVLYDYDLPDAFDENGWPQAGFITKTDNAGLLPEVYGIPYTSKRGYNTEHIGDEDDPIIETYLDIRNEKPSCDNAWKRDVYQISVDDMAQRAQDIANAQSALAAPADGSSDLKSIYEAFEASLKGRGEQHLKDNYYIVNTLDTGLVNAKDYLHGFDLGDLVDMEVSTLGFTQEARIIEVEESYTSGNVEIKLTMGDKTLTNIQKARLA